MDKPTRILMTALLVLLMAGSAMCETHTVCASGCDYTTIQAAINAASKDDTIIVDDGTYNENVVVNQTVIIGSENGSASTTIVAIDPKFHAVTITANDVDMSGFTVTNATGNDAAGIWVEGMKAYIFQNIMTGNTIGIHLQSANKYNVSCNTIVDNDACGAYVVPHSNDGSDRFTLNSIVQNGELMGAIYKYQVMVIGKEHGLWEVNMSSNYWGTEVTDDINASINCSDGCDVNIMPPLDGRSPCAPIPELPTVMLTAIGLVGLVGLIRHKPGE
jgi:nitrous oxidase accessory protein NosD